MVLSGSSARVSTPELNLKSQVLLVGTIALAFDHAV